MWIAAQALGEHREPQRGKTLAFVAWAGLGWAADGRRGLMGLISVAGCWMGKAGGWGVLGVEEGLRVGHD